MVVIDRMRVRDTIWPAADAVIHTHLERMGWLDDDVHEMMAWSPNDIPNDIIEEAWASSFHRLPEWYRHNFSERIIHAMLPRRYWYKKPEPRDPAKATRWRRAKCRAGVN